MMCARHARRVRRGHDRPSNNAAGISRPLWRAYHRRRDTQHRGRGRAAARAIWPPPAITNLQKFVQRSPKTRRGTQCQRMGMAAASTVTATVLDLIKAAQDGGCSDGRRELPPYATALAEITAGQKVSHWIWYVWPSLASIRPNVRLKQFLLPNLPAAVAYAADPALAPRMREISAAALSQLRDGTTPQQLFGKLHRYDAPKFHETSTLFALAAIVAGNAELAATCGEAAAAVCGGLHGPTVALALAEGGGWPAAAAELTERYSTSY